MIRAPRIRELDGIRGLAIVMVLLAHYIQNPLITVSGVLPKYTAKLLSLTWSGVDLFFVLSGFLICGILIDNKGSPTLFRTFYVRRSLRILPLYFLLLGIFFLLKSRLVIPPLFDHALPFWSYATFTQNIVMVQFPDTTNYWLGLTWSLAVEEQFYLILPLVVALFPKRYLMGLFCVGILGAALLRLLFPGYHAYLLTPWRADALLTGALVALLVRSSVVMSWIAKNKRLLVAAFLVLLAGAGIMTAKPWSSWARNHLWLAMLYGSFLLVALTNAMPPINRILRSGWLVWMGAVSYGVYLLHGPVAGLLHWFISGTGVELRTSLHFATTALAMLITLGLAALSFRYFETPLLGIAHKLKYRPSKANPGPMVPGLVAMTKGGNQPATE